MRRYDNENLLWQSGPCWLPVGSGKDSWTPELKAFAANGGKVVFVADTAEKRRVAAEFDGAIVVESCDKVIDVL